MSQFFLTALQLNSIGDFSKSKKWEVIMNRIRKKYATSFILEKQYLIAG